MPGTSSNSSSLLKEPILARYRMIAPASSGEQPEIFLTRSSTVQVFRLKATEADAAAGASGSAGGGATGLEGCGHVSEMTLGMTGGSGRGMGGGGLVGMGAGAEAIAGAGSSISGSGW